MMSMRQLSFLFVRIPANRIGQVEKIKSIRANACQNNKGAFLGEHTASI